MMEFIRETIRKTNVDTFLIVSTTLLLASIIYMLFFLTVPEASKGVLYGLVGTVASGWSGILGYRFGSSVGSAKKTDAMISNGKPSDG